MYCSDCGLAIPQGQSYCNRCGAELKGTAEASAARPTNSILVPAMVFVTVFGLAAIAALVAVTERAPEFQASWIFAIVFLGFLLILAADVFFAYLLLRSKRQTQERDMKQLITAELNQRMAAALPQPAFSVTEQTTRHLEPVEHDGEK